MKTLLNTRKTVLIENELGLHARPAAMIARIVRNAEDAVWLVYKNHRADASSVIDILTLNAEKGCRMTVEIESEKDVSVLDELVEFFESGFGENADG
ncbi:HPr family phosphocarrier protein [Desulfamplus magnetovallimortis]|uniref:HPr family phosphocarrier protein n=1 Tax=Desulfamplus magnetovallimortis TaxID=1246637 RepID=UPI001FEB03E6|nr:HPr family phosphocarrier protein [Desulfamplus magnetovallimortis]